jgi:hypothetical protein
LFVDLGALNEGIEDVKNRVATPCVWIFAEEVRFFFLRGCTGNSIAVSAEGFELVDKLVDYVPCPVVLYKVG